MGLRVQEWNFKHEMYAFKRNVSGVQYLDFGLLSPEGEILLERMINETSAGDVVYDVGAYTGDYSLPLATKGCTVYSFEPHTETYKKLVKNIRANGINNVTCFNRGVSDERGELTFYQSSQPACSSFNRYNAEKGDAEILSEATIEVITIDQLVDNTEIDPPKHIKIDVEGLGIEVINGGLRTIRDYTPMIYLETHESADSSCRTTDLYGILHELGYQVNTFGHSWVCKPVS